MTNIIEQFNREQEKKLTITAFRTGDTVVVKRRIREGNRERLQAFEGVVIAQRRKNSINGTFTVRKTTHNISVEYVIPVHSPLTESITVKRRGKVRRKNLYYLRKLTGKKARIKEKL